MAWNGFKMLKVRSANLARGDRDLTSRTSSVCGYGDRVPSLARSSPMDIDMQQIEYACVGLWEYRRYGFDHWYSKITFYHNIYNIYIHDVVAWLKLQRGEGLSFFSPLCAMQHSRIQQELLIAALGGMSKDKDRCSMMPEPVCAVEYSASSPSRWQPYRCVLSWSDAFNTAFSYKPKASPCKRQHVLLHCCFCLHKQFASFYHYKHPRKI